MWYERLTNSDNESNIVNQINIPMAPGDKMLVLGTWEVPVKLLVLFGLWKGTHVYLFVTIEV